jgi:hypothetical protein
MRSRWFGFPNPVNETSARLVAGGVVLQAIAYLATGSTWLLFPLAYGFLARVLGGPRYSPLGQFVTRLITPRVHATHKFVAGPPKRFAQGVGLAFSSGALLSAALGWHPVAIVLIAFLLVAATLESVFAYCLGCMMFRYLMAFGVIPESVCVECNDITARLASAMS